MNVIISSKSLLLKKYGLAGFQSINDALFEYVKALGESTLLFYIDDADSMAPIHLAPVAAVESGTVLMSLRNIRSALTSVTSICLVGGDDIIPHWRLANPVADRSIDPDRIVYSDNPYGAVTDDLASYLAPETPIGRVLDASTGNSATFTATLRDLLINHASPKKRTGATSVYNDQWAPMSRRVDEKLPIPVDEHEVPGFQVTTSNQADLDRRFLYFNLHGFVNDPAWKGFDDIRGQFVAAITPDSFDRTYVSGSVIFAENCYSAYTISKSATTSCAIQAVEQGVAGFVGSTGLAFGSHIEPGFFLENADLLASQFFNYAASGINSIGESLSYARRDYMNDEASPLSNPFKQKTLMQFNLLGNPNLTI